MHENALKSILESPEISEKGSFINKSVMDFDNWTEEIPLEEHGQNIENGHTFEEFGFDDPFFTKLGISLHLNDKSLEYKTQPEKN